MRRVIFVLASAIIAILPARAGDATLTGQVVCSSCWHEAERPKVPYGNDADVACAKRCAGEGIPRALAVAGAGGSFELVILEARAVPGGSAAILDLVGAAVEARGDLDTSQSRRILRVDAIRVVQSRAEVLAHAVTRPEKAPALILRDLLGGEQSLEALRGRIVVLNFWATWCVPCRDEMPALARVQDRYGAWGVQVIGAAADAPEARAAVVAFAKKTKVNFPVWLGATTDAMTSFGLTPVLPGTVVIDRDGSIVFTASGAVTEEPLAAAIDRLIAAAAPTVVAKSGGVPRAPSSSVPP